MIIFRGVDERLTVTTSTGADIDWTVVHTDKTKSIEASATQYGKITTATTTEITDDLQDLFTVGYSQYSRHISYLSFVNVDSIAQTIYVSIYNSTAALSYKLTPTVTLAAGEALVFSGGSWNTINSTGSSAVTEIVTRKMLGQSAPNATTETDLYTCPAATTAVIGSLMVCNRGATATFRVSVSVGGGATATKDYYYYDLLIAANDSFLLEMLRGLNLAATDKVRVYASTANLSFNANGEENS